MEDDMLTEFFLTNFLTNYLGKKILFYYFILIKK